MVNINEEEYMKAKKIVLKDKVKHQNMKAYIDNAVRERNWNATHGGV